MFGSRSARKLRPVVRRNPRGRRGLVIGVHGYGGDERQLETLVPLNLPITTAVPRAPFPVEPGYGWWLPEAQSSGLELAPAAAVDAAVQRLADTIATEQADGGFSADDTFVVGYSQGAALALTLAARRPTLSAGVVTGAGALLPGEIVGTRLSPLRVLIMNGTLDPLVTTDAHTASIEAFRQAGHDVREQVDAVPHVIDSAQARIASQTLAGWLAVSHVER